MKKPELLILVAIWEFLSAFGALIGIAAISIFTFPNIWWGGVFPVAPIFGLSIAILVLLCFIGLAVAGGIGLLQGKEWGRSLSIAHAALSLFWIPIGTVIGILCIIYLTKSDVAAYFTANR